MNTYPINNKDNDQIVMLRYDENMTCVTFGWQSLNNPYIQITVSINIRDIIGTISFKYPLYRSTHHTVHVPIIHNNVVANEMHKESWPIILGKINMVKGPFYIYLNIYQDTTSPIDAK